MIPIAELYRIAKLYEAPEFLKVAELEYDDSALKSQQFADMYGRRFPIHTKTATYISNAQFWERGVVNDKESSEVGKRLLEAANFFNIMPEVQKNILTKIAKQDIINVVEGLPDDAFAIVTETSAGKVRLYPMINDETVKMAGDQFYAERTRLPITWRRQAARNLYKQAQSRNVDFDRPEVADYIERAAGRGLASADSMAGMLNDRAEELFKRANSEAGRKLLKLAVELKKYEPTMEVCVKVANLVGELDQTTGLHKKYGSNIALPEDTCHAVLQQHANDILSNYVQLPSGNMYARADLIKASASIIEALEGEVNVAAKNGELDMTKMAQAAPDLAEDAGRYLELSLAAQGILPAKLPRTLGELALLATA